MLFFRFLVYWNLTDKFTTKECLLPQTKPFDLAILDMQLPDGTGFDVSEKLKDTKTAVIFVTIVDEEGKILHAFENGAVSYELPWLAMIFCVGVVFLVTWASARCAARRLRNRNIIETIRSEGGR